MATVILSHKVKDFDTWKVGFDTDRERRSAIGVEEIAVGKKSDDPSMAYVILNVKDTSVMAPMMADEQLQKAMAEAGVISAPEMIILE